MVGTCAECGRKKTLETKTTCASCRKKLQRLKKVAEEPVKAVATTSTPLPPTPGLSGTDRLFDAQSPGYYLFDEEPSTRSCWVCNKQFTTRLRLLKTCCPDHQQELLLKFHTGSRRDQ